jgi:hypothetical protein
MTTMNHALILLPLAALVALVMLMTALMLRERVHEMKARRIHPQKVATSTQMAGVLQNTRAADNYKNLFEMPVLFYACCLALLALQAVTPLLLGLAWLYVALRCVHSFIHVGYNQVMHRFNVFALSALVLLVMWVLLVVHVLQRG